jgi:hypothetical protein
VAEVEFAAQTGSATTSAVPWTAGRVITPPNGGGLNTLAFNAIVANPGAVVWRVNLASFIPTAAGGVISAAMRRFTGGSGGNGWSCFIWLCGQGTAIGDDAYMLGLTEGNPGRIVLRKGPLSDGVPDAPPPVVQGTLTQGVLTRSSDTVALGDWVHLRLSAKRNANGEVPIRVRRNNLAVNAVTAPVWEAVPGMADFIDDQASIATGTPSLLNGYTGIGLRMNAAYQRVAFDAIAGIAEPWP